MGVPVLTSRLVGASECLPDAYASWLLDRPEPAELAARAVTLLADAESARTARALRRRATVVQFDERAYARSDAAADRSLRTGGSSRRLTPRKVVEVVGPARPCGSVGSKLSRAILSPKRRSIASVQLGHSSLSCTPPPK